jgi:hypothetical protein
LGEIYYKLFVLALDGESEDIIMNLLILSRLILILWTVAWDCYLNSVKFLKPTKAPWKSKEALNSEVASYSKEALNSKEPLYYFAIFQGIAIFLYLQFLTEKVPIDVFFISLKRNDLIRLSLVYTTAEK